MVRRILWRALIAGAVMCSLTSHARAAEEFTKRVKGEEVIELSGERILVVNERGMTKIRPSDRNELVLQAVKVVYADSEEDAAELFKGLTLDVREESAGALSITVGHEGVARKRSLFRFMGRLQAPHIDLEIEVPSGCTIRLESGSGTIDIIGTECELEIATASSYGEISSHTGAIRIEMTSGSFRLERLDGPVVVSGTSGDVEVSDVTGNVEVHVSAGDVVCNDIDGDLTVRTGTGDGFVSGGMGPASVESTTGDVEVISREGPVIIDTGGGDVTFWLDPLPTETYEVSTSSGDIEFRLPTDTSAILTVWTTSGEIYAKVPMRILAVSRTNLKGKIGDGGASVTFKTISGNVRVLPLR